MFELIWNGRKIIDDPYNIINLIFKYNDKFYIEYYNNLTNKRYLNQLSENVSINSIYNRDLIIIEDEELFKELQSLVYEINKFI